MMNVIVLLAALCVRRAAGALLLGSSKGEAILHENGHVLDVVWGGADGGHHGPVGLHATGKLGAIAPVAVVFSISNETWSTAHTEPRPSASGPWEHAFPRPTGGGEYEAKFVLICDPICQAATNCGACFGTAMLSATRRVLLEQETPARTETTTTAARALQQTTDNRKNSDWWAPAKWTTSKETVAPCFNEEACLQQDCSDNEENCTITCNEAEGYANGASGDPNVVESIMCGVCKRGYYRTPSRCVACAHSTLIAAGMGGVILVTYAGFLWKAITNKGRESRSAAFWRVVITYYTVNTHLAGGTLARIPALFKQFMDQNRVLYDTLLFIFSPASALECLAPDMYESLYESYVLTILAPYLFVALVGIGLFLYESLHERLRHKEQEGEDDDDGGAAAAAAAAAEEDGPRGGRAQGGFGRGSESGRRSWSSRRSRRGGGGDDAPQKKAEDINKAASISKGRKVAASLVVILYSLYPRLLGEALSVFECTPVPAVTKSCKNVDEVPRFLRSRLSVPCRDTTLLARCGSPYVNQTDLTLADSRHKCQHCAFSTRAQLPHEVEDKCDVEGVPIPAVWGFCSDMSTSTYAECIETKGLLWVPDHEDYYHYVFIVAVFTITVYAAIVPGVLLYVTTRNASTLHETHYKAVWGFLYAGIKIPHWELWLLTRKLCVLLVLVFITDPFLQSFLVLFVMLAALMLQLQYRPFVDPALNRLEALCLETIIFTQSVTLAHHYFSGVEGDGSDVYGGAMSGGGGGDGVGGATCAAEKTEWPIAVDLSMIAVNCDTIVLIVVSAWSANKEDLKSLWAQLKAFVQRNSKQVAREKADFEHRERLYYMSYSDVRRQCMADAQHTMAKLHRKGTLEVLDAVRSVGARTAQLVNSLTDIAEMDSFPLPSKWDLTKGMSVEVNRDGTWLPAAIERVSGTFVWNSLHSRKIYQTSGTYAVVFEDPGVIGNRDPTVGELGCPVDARVSESNLRVMKPGDRVEVEGREGRNTVFVGVTRDAEKYVHRIMFVLSDVDKGNWPKHVEWRERITRDDFEVVTDNYTSQFNLKLPATDVGKMVKVKIGPSAKARALIVDVEEGGEHFSVIYEDSERQRENNCYVRPERITRRRNAGCDFVKGACVEVWRDELDEYVLGIVARVNTSFSLQEAKDVSDGTFAVIYEERAVIGSRLPEFEGDPVDPEVDESLIRPATTKRGTRVEVDYGTHDIIRGLVCSVNRDGSYAVQYERSPRNGKTVDKVAVPHGVDMGEAFTATVRGTKVDLVADTSVAEVFIDIKVPAETVRLLVSEKFKQILKAWARSEQLAFRQLEMVESNIVDEAIVLHKAAVEKIMVRCATEADKVLENVYKAKERQLTALDESMYDDTFFSTFEERQIFLQSILPHLAKVQFTIDEMKGYTTNVDARQREVLEVNSDVEEAEENLDMEEDPAVYVRDMISVHDVLPSGATVEEELDRLLARSQELRDARLTEADSAAAQALHAVGNALRCTLLCAKAAPTVKELGKERERLQQQLSALGEDGFDDGEDRLAMDALRRDIQALDEKLELFDAFNARKELQKRLLGQRLTDQERDRVLNQLGPLDAKLDEFDSMEIKLIRRVRLHKRRAELKAMLARDKEPAPRLHEWKAALKAEEAARHEQLEDRAKLKSETTAAKARLKSLSEFEDFGGQLDSDEETERDELSNRLGKHHASTQKLEALNDALKKHDALKDKVDLKTHIDTDTWRQVFLEKKLEQQHKRRKRLKGVSSIPIPGLESLFLLTSKREDRKAAVVRLERKAEHRRQNKTKLKLKANKRRQRAAEGGRVTRLASMGDLGFHGGTVRKQRRNKALWARLRVKTDSMIEQSKSQKIVSMLVKGAQDDVAKRGGRVKNNLRAMAEAASDDSNSGGENDDGDDDGDAGGGDGGGSGSGGGDGSSAKNSTRVGSRRGSSSSVTTRKSPGARRGSNSGRRSSTSSITSRKIPGGPPRRPSNANTTRGSVRKATLAASDRDLRESRRKVESAVRKVESRRKVTLATADATRGSSRKPNLSRHRSGTIKDANSAAAFASLRKPSTAAAAAAAALPRTNSQVGDAMLGSVPLRTLPRTRSAIMRVSTRRTAANSALTAMQAQQAARRVVQQAATPAASRAGGPAQTPPRRKHPGHKKRKHHRRHGNKVRGVNTLAALDEQAEFMAAAGGGVRHNDEEEGGGGHRRRHRHRHHRRRHHATAEATHHLQMLDTHDEEEG